MQGVDLVVIGSGAAGGTIARTCRERGWTVAIVDAHPFGGTCQLRGCDPKKVLVGAAHAVESATRFAGIGVFDRAPKLQWPELMRFKETFVQNVPAEHAKAYAEAGILAVNGVARFLDEQTLQVGDRKFRAAHVAIAAGAKPAPLVPGDDLLLDNEDFLNLPELPPSLLFIGGGYITFEFAHVAARAGAHVTILHRGVRPLEGFDAALVAQLVESTRELGIVIHLNAEVKKIERRADGIVAHAVVDGTPQAFSATTGVHGAGRIADLEDLDLGAGNVARTAHGVKVNRYLQSTSNPRVYAAGDAADGGGKQLTPVAGDEGAIVAHNMLDGNSRSPDFRGLASIVYTIPPLAMVGLDERTAREQGLDVETKRGDMSAWYSSRRLREKRAAFMLVLERASKKIVGGGVFGPHAEEQINVLALAIRNNLTTDAIQDAFFAYPTGGSDLQYMFE